MGLPAPISWPIAAAGIATKNSPIQLAPGGQLVLDNVRQERKDEWRVRAGFTHESADDITDSLVPVVATETPWGGLVGLVRQTTAATAGRMFEATALPHWITPPLIAVNGSISGQQSCAQQTPATWKRQPIAPMNGGHPSQVSVAEGGNYRLTAWWDSELTGTTGIQVSLTSLDGASISYSSQFASTPAASRPRCVYNSAANRLVLVYIDNANQVIAYAWNTLTGALVVTAKVISTAAYAAVVQGAYLDALYYGGPTVTIAYRNATGTGELDIAEYNPATNVATVYHPAISVENCLSLFTDPDASGIRMVGICTGVPDVRVLRLDNVGTVLTNHLVVAGDTQNIAGVAYEAGVSWMVVFGHTLGLLGCKRRAGVTSPLAIIAPPSVSGAFKLASNAWREASTDAMRYTLAVVGGIASAADTQTTFYEMALEFENASAAIKNWWTEPQSRMLPLNAGAGYIERAAIPQVQRVGADRFVTALPRITKANSAGGAQSYDFAIDVWSVQYRNSTTYTGQNVGAGTLTKTNAFLIAGQLLQTGTGQLLCAHGASALPFQPGLAASAGAGSLTTKTYVYGVTVRMPDESGNDWRSPMSLTASKLLAGAENTITVSVYLTPFENLVRRRIVEIWRTDGNGSTFKLLASIKGGITDTVNITYVDASNDVMPGETFTAEVQTGLTPPLSHVVLWNNRLWGVDRDFQKLWFTKPLSTGLLPEFIADPATSVEFSVDLTDQYGDATGLAAMDDKIVILKERAAYVLGGDGPDNTGNGAFPTANRISSEVGHIAGAPLASTGREVYIVSLGGLFRISGGQEIDFVGASIDRYLSMPLLTSPETVTGMVVSPTKNEVRVQTTGYRFVHDRTFDQWIRDTGGMLAANGIVMTKMLGGTTQIVITSAGQLWREAEDSDVVDDAGIDYAGTIRTAWIKPANIDGWIQLFRARALGEVTTTGTTDNPILTVFYDYDDSYSESFQPIVPVGNTAGPLRAEGQVRKQRCTSFSLQLEMPTDSTIVRLDAWSATVSVIPTAVALPLIKKWVTSPVAVPGPTPVPPSPYVPVPRRQYNITTLASQLLGTQGRNASDLLIQVKNTWVASGFWSVVRSSDGVTVAASDLWINYTNVRGLGGPGGYSWIILRNSATGVEVLFYCSVSIVWTEIIVWCSPAAGFTGGDAAGVAPTATDQYTQTPPAGADWLGVGPNGDPLFRAFNWQSTDGAMTRVAWFYGGNLIAWWQFDTITASVGTPGSWVPFVTVGWEGGGDYTAPLSRMFYTTFSNTHIQTKTIGGFIETPIPWSEEWINNYFIDVFPQNEFTLQYYWAPPVGLNIALVAPPRNGPIGFLDDQWWVGRTAPPPGGTPVFNDGDTANNGAFIFLGQMMLPWNGTIGAPGFAAPVDRPSTDFVGRGVL